MLDQLLYSCSSNCYVSYLIETVVISSFFFLIGNMFWGGFILKINPYPLPDFPILLNILFSCE